MAKRRLGLMETLLYRRTLRRWQRHADQAAKSDVETLARLNLWARSLRRNLDRVIQAAEMRLALPLIGSNAMKKPLGTDWSWRPDLWKGPLPVPGQASVPARAPLAEGTTIFHDCRRSELTVRQIRNTRESDIAPFGFRMDVFRFDGSFLSLVLDLPD